LAQAVLAEASAFECAMLISLGSPMLRPLMLPRWSMHQTRLMFRPSAMAILLVCVLLSLPRPADAANRKIVDFKSDIRELDVGDLEDMESDVPPSFLDDLKRKNNPIKMPSFTGTEDAVDFAANAQSGMQMSFAMLNMAKTEELLKPGTDRLASVWKSMLTTGGVEAQSYAVDPGQILFVTNGPGLVSKIKQFVLEQAEVDWWEYQSKRYYPPGRDTPLMDHDDRKKRKVELGWEKPAADPAAAPAKDDDDSKSKKKKKKKKGN